MTSQEWVTIIAAIGLVLTQAITAWRTNTKVQAVQESAERAEHTADIADQKLDAIHTLTNSNLQTAKDEARMIKDELKAANERIANLERILDKTVEVIVPAAVAAIAGPEAAPKVE
jgi:Mg2+ and Co2+ transporter CorA